MEVLGSNYDNDSVKLVSATVLDGTRQLEYYGLLDSSRIKTSTSGSANTWWLRTANSNTIDSFLRVYSRGAVNVCRASSYNGVAPAFRILD